MTPIRVSSERLCPYPTRKSIAVYRKVYGQGGFGDLFSCLKIFKLMEIEQLPLIRSLFTNGLKKGSAHISIKLDVLYLDLHENRLKTELML